MRHLAAKLLSPNVREQDDHKIELFTLKKKKKKYFTEIFVQGFIFRVRHWQIYIFFQNIINLPSKPGFLQWAQALLSFYHWKGNFLQYNLIFAISPFIFTPTLSNKENIILLKFISNLQFNVFKKCE